MKRRAMLGAALAASLSPLSGYAAASKESYDVIVVGSGVAGLTAAVSASENGAKRVLLIEKNSTIGGHSILSTGYLSAVPEGSPAEAFESMFEGMQKLAHGRGNVALRRIMVRESGSALKWLTDMGLTWEQDVYQTLAGLAPRSYISSTVRAGYDYVVTLNKTARRLGVHTLFETRADRLVTDKRARVCALEAVGSDGRRATFSTKAVVLATGGFGGNVKMRMQFDPRLNASFPTTADPNFDGTDSAQGDGIEMGQALGAGVVDMDCIQILPFWGGRLTDYVGADIYLDSNGRRFVNEGSSWKEISDKIYELPGKTCWVVTDSQSRQGAHRSVKIMFGVVRSAGSIEEMAQGMGVDPATLAQTLERYNKFAAAGNDADFGKTMFTQQINKPPYYYGQERLYVHYCCGGLAIDEFARVLRTDGTPIEGLFAAGEVTGGIHGRDRLGGCSITDCLVFGRIAGRCAAGLAAAPESA